MLQVKDRIPVAALCCPPVTVEQLDEATAVEFADVLKALADPVRLRLVSIIASAPTGEICACDLPALLDRAQATVSHHLTQLFRAGLIDREQRGKWAWFRIRPDGFAAIRAALGEGFAPEPLPTAAG
jgi:ArsR family transcriptional regulator, arsenate/arsenite/antimonite-responsive transcriptional repressor